MDVEPVLCLEHHLHSGRGVTANLLGQKERITWVHQQWSN